MQRGKHAFHFGGEPYIRHFLSLLHREFRFLRAHGSKFLNKSWACDALKDFFGNYIFNQRVSIFQGIHLIFISFSRHDKYTTAVQRNVCHFKTFSVNLFSCFSQTCVRSGYYIQNSKYLVSQINIIRLCLAYFWNLIGKIIEEALPGVLFLDIRLVTLKVLKNSITCMGSFKNYVDKQGGRS